jgi:site-specific DNA-methyltransferase (adenine-specific)
MLVPARTDVKWFHKALEYGAKVQFIKGRLKFGNSKQSAPFPSIFLIFPNKIS